MSITRLPIGIALFLALSVSRSVWAERPAADPAAGRAAYQQQCARCHGEQGKGDGVDAKRFYPRPRDLALGVYKFRSTASGTPPTDDDLFHTITEGLPGSNMPDWKHLDEATRWHLVDYLKNLAPIFEETMSEPVPVAADPTAARADLAKGKAVYEQLGCAACHGVQGRANGTSAAGLVDDWGKPIRPANLTKGWSYRGGSAPRDTMLRLLTGIDGAGMPSYTGAVSPENAWQLAYYVASLQEPPHWNLIARVARINGQLPSTLDDPRWQSAERTDVRLRNAVEASGEWVEPPIIVSVTFRVMYNEEGIALLAMWDDPTQDQGESPDRLALLLRSPGVQGDVVSLQAWPYEGAPKLDVCLWSADTAQVEEAVAESYERTDASTLVSSAHYEDGRWRLLVQRALRPASPAGAAALTADVLHPIAFTIWDGANSSARAVSPWIDLTFTD